MHNITLAEVVSAIVDFKLGNDWFSVMIKRDRGRIGAVRGTTTMRGISAPPIATGTIRTTGTTISGFVAPVLLRGS